MKNNPHSVDRFYKFCLKRLGIKFYQFFFHKGDTIQYIETETAETGQRKDAVVIVDKKTIHIIEFMSTPLTDDKLKDMFDYWGSIFFDPKYQGFKLKCSVLSIANPNEGIKEVEISENVTFCTEIIFLKNIDGAKILSTLVNKIKMQEDLTENETVSLCLLADMNIDIPIEALINIISVLFSNANIANQKLKRDIYSCLIMLIARFFSGEKFEEIVNMLEIVNRDPKVARIVEKYGPGFDEVYYFGKENGFYYANIRMARKLLAKGVDMEFISDCTDISIEELEEIKRKL